jgi:predicted transcriptional regulator
MERLFKALAHKDRLWIVQRVAANGPTKQKDLALALGESGRKRPNRGTMSAWIKELADAGLVEHDGQQDSVRLTNDEQVGRLLTLASALTVAVTTKAQEAAEARHSELIRGITKAQNDHAAEG